MENRGAKHGPSASQRPGAENRNEQKRASVKKYAALRAELKAKKDYVGLAQLPRDASPTRIVPMRDLAFQGPKQGLGRGGVYTNINRARDAVSAANAGTAGRTAGPD